MLNPMTARAASTESPVPCCVKCGVPLGMAPNHGHYEPIKLVSSGETAAPKKAFPFPIHAR
jgi:hypothetical protein